MPPVGLIADTRIYLGLDPGASGGIAWVSSDSVESVAMPSTDRDIWDWLTAPGPFGEERTLPTHAVLEKVNGYVGDGGNPGSAMFKFGTSYGSLKMALTAAGIPFEEIPPQTWQKALGIPKRKKGESKTVWKNRLKAHAQRLFPQEKITLATADALLIATYCKRKCEGLL